MSIRQRVMIVRLLPSLSVTVTRADKSEFTITARCRIETFNELEYFRSGGILHYVLRKLAVQ